MSLPHQQPYSAVSLSKRTRGTGSSPAIAIVTLMLLIGFNLATLPSTEAMARNEAVFRLATSSQTFGGFNQNDTAAALLAWARSIVKEKGLNVRTEMVVFSQFEKLRRAFHSGKIDAASLNVREIRVQLEAALTELHHTVGGRQLLTTFQCSRMEKHPASVLGPTIRFIHEYNETRRKGLLEEAQP